MEIVILSTLAAGVGYILDGFSLLLYNIAVNLPLLFGNDEKTNVISNEVRNLNTSFESLIQD